MSKKCIVIRMLIFSISAFFVIWLLHDFYVSIDIGGMPMVTKGIKIIIGFYFFPVICVTIFMILLIFIKWLCDNFSKKDPKKQGGQMMISIKRCFIFALIGAAFFAYFGYSDFAFFEFKLLPQEINERSSEIIALILLGFSLVAIFAISLWLDLTWREKCADWLEIFLKKVMRCSPDD